MSSRVSINAKESSLMKDDEPENQEFQEKLNINDNNNNNNEISANNN